MDIKGLARNIFPSSVKSLQESKSTHSKTDADNDREGNGQAQQGEPEKARALTPEELEEAVKHLESLAGVKDNGLRVRLSSSDGVHVIYVEDRDGKVVRRIPESEIYFILQNRTKNSEKKSGQLLNRAV